MKTRNFRTPTVQTKPGTGVEANYPGQRLGMTLDQTKQYVQNQVKSVGIKSAMVVGPVNEKIQLPGDASILIGIAFDPQGVNDISFTLNVNQSIVHEDIGTVFATAGNAGGLGIQPFFPVHIPVTGNDTIKLDFNSSWAGTLRTLIYYK